MHLVLQVGHKSDIIFLATVVWAILWCIRLCWLTDDFTARSRFLSQAQMTGRVCARFSDVRVLTTNPCLLLPHVSACGPHPLTPGKFVKQSGRRTCYDSAPLFFLKPTEKRAFATGSELSVRLAGLQQDHQNSVPLNYLRSSGVPLEGGVSP